MPKRILVVTAILVFVAGFVFALGAATVSVTAAPGDGEAQTRQAAHLAQISEATGLVASETATSPACTYDNGYQLYLCPQPEPLFRPLPNPAEAVVAQQLLAGGVGLLLVPDSDGDRVMAFHPVTGDLINANYIPTDPDHLTLPKNAILGPLGNTILVSDQSDDVVREYDLSGAFIRTFAPAGGPNPAVLDNILGIALRPNGNLLVTVDGGVNQDSVAEFDLNGNYLGNFIETNAGGINAPFDIYQRTADWMVSSSTSDDLNRFHLNTGAFVSEFALVDNFPQQIAEAANNNLLLGNFDGIQEGVIEFNPSGGVVGIYDPVEVGQYRGVYELPNGNILTSNDDGVYEIDRAGNLVETKISDVNAQYIELVQPSSSGSRPVEIEPNNVISQATGLPSPGPIEVRGNITPTGDHDWFSLEANAGNLLFSAVRTGGSTSGGDSQLRAYTPVGSLLEFDDDDGNDGLGNSLASVVAGVSLALTDTYFLRVNENGDNGLITPYQLYVQLHDPADMVDEVESNDTFETANAVAATALVSGNIGISNDADWYAVTLGEEETLFASLDGDPGRPPNSGADFTLSLFDSDGSNMIWTADDVGGNDPSNPPAEAGVYDALAPGTYYLLVEGASGPVTGDYLLSVGVIPALNPPVRSIVFEKTAGTNPSDCATGNEIQVQPGTLVTYCYRVINTGNVTFSLHSLVDSELGTLLSDHSHSLIPGASYFITESETILTHTVNSATWTAYNAGPSDVISATSLATVTMLLAPDIATDPTAIYATQKTGAQVTQTLTILNNGSGELEWEMSEEPTGGQETATAGNGPTITATYALVPPTLDGSIGSLEWSEAYSLNITLSGTPVYMYVMADAETLYLAFDDQADPTLDAFDQVGIYFDDEGGVPPTLYDNNWTNLQCGPPNTGEGNFWLGNFSPDPDDQWRAFRTGGSSCETQFGGTNNEVGYSDSTGHMQYEAAIPLGGSSALVAQAGQIFGFRVYTAHTGSTFTGRWPNPSNFNEPATFGNIRLPVGGCEDGSIPWLTAVPTSGTTAPGNSTDVTVTFNSAGLDPGTYTGNLCITSNDPDEPYVQVPATMLVPIGPAISLVKTVGLDPDVCATTDTITVEPGTAVTYCYTVHNVGSDTLTLHNLVDSELGTLLNEFSYNLAPGTSAFVTETAVITSTTTNLATWTAFNSGHSDEAVATDTATVGIPSISLEKTVGLNPNVCANSDNLSVLPGATVTYCYRITNTGTVTLTTHDLIDSELGVILNDYSFNLSPSATMFVTRTAVILHNTVNLATWTAQTAGGVSVLDTDTAMVTIGAGSNQLYLPAIIRK